MTNEDDYSLGKFGRIPGNGALVASVEAMLTNSQGDGLICEKHVVGKPNPDIINLIRRDFEIPEADLPKFIVIGDNPSTDIALGNNAGIDSCLVLTGVTRNAKEAREWAAQKPEYSPTYIMESFGEDLEPNTE